MIIVPVHEFNPNHEPAGSSKGGQFARSQGVGSQKLLPPHTPTPRSILATGTPGDISELGGGANASILVDMTLDDGSEAKAVFKPEIGEMWKGSFMNGEINQLGQDGREFSLAQREAAAYEVDQLLGTNVVPETVHRQQLDIDFDNVHTENEDAYDEDELRHMYDEYRDEERQNIQDRGDAYDKVADQLYEQYGNEKESFVNKVEAHVDVVHDIWNELVEEGVGNDRAENDRKYGSVDKQPKFEGMTGAKMRGERSDALDPLDVLDEAGVDNEIRRNLGREDRDAIRRVLRKKIEDEGYGELGDYDESAAKSKFATYDDWRQDHEDTEMRLLDSAVESALLSFTRWREQNGYSIRGGSGGSGIDVKNPKAPFPRGGSLQRFVSDLDYGYPESSEQWKVAVLDYAIGALDRHGHNLLNSGGKAVAIDNGYSFPGWSNPTFRSISMDYVARQAGEGSPDMPEGIRKALLQNITTADWGKWLDSKTTMSKAEKTYFRSRIEELKELLQTPTGFANHLYNGGVQIMGRHQ